MKKINILCLIFMLLTLTSCSNNTSKSTLNKNENKSITNDKCITDLDSLLAKLNYNEKWRKQINKKGRLFILIDKDCLSSAFVACTQFKDNTNAIFYGAPTVVPIIPLADLIGLLSLIQI